MTMSVVVETAAESAVSPFVIPTIDIAPYLQDPSSEASARVVEEVRRACTTSGFFQIVGHGVSRELQRAILRAAEVLFALPLDEKKKLRHPGLKNRGYELLGSQVLQEGALPDLKEGFYISQHVPQDDARSREHPYLIGPNVFPSGVADGAAIREPAETYYAALLALSCKVMEMLARGLPYGDDVFAAFASNDPLCILRLLHYPPQPPPPPAPPVEAETEAEGKPPTTTDVGPRLGAGAHTDFGAITLLLQDETGGLEVYDRAAGAWMPVEPNPDGYVVNIGDMLSLWTGGTYKSTLHRVINTSGRDRYSVPFFFDGNLDVELAPLDGSAPPGGGKAPTVEGHILERYGATYKKR
ncbi:Clavaminate synthase-like protein [Biscogniauxia mediterranea]|nr:Clavaminate synthase-like protein [Biscogniauxia mediterranea]